MGEGTTTSTTTSTDDPQTTAPESSGSSGSSDEGTTTGGGTACRPGETRSCYGGPASTADVGICRSGTQTCTPDGAGFGPCEGDVQPESSDSCLTEDDDDCDGTPNELCVCRPGDQIECYNGPAGTAGVGACMAGTRTCNRWGTGYDSCIGQVTPSADSCQTAADEDCDGANDPCPIACDDVPPVAVCQTCSFLPAQIACGAACSNAQTINASGECSVGLNDFEACLNICQGLNPALPPTSPSHNNTFGCLTGHATCAGYLDCYFDGCSP